MEFGLIVMLVFMVGLTLGYLLNNDDNPYKHV